MSATTHKAAGAWAKAHRALTNPEGWHGYVPGPAERGAAYGFAFLMGCIVGKGLFG